MTNPINGVTTPLPAGRGKGGGSSIAIFGGSFNPIHKGHVRLAQAICKAGLAEEVWLMVSPLNPLKQNDQSELLDDNKRLHLARLATAATPCIQASDFEFHLPIPSYTVNTLTELQEAYPQHTFSLRIGEDNWQRFSRWYQSDVIRSRHDIIVYGRKENTESTERNGIVTVHHTDGSEETHEGFQLYNISSTLIRQALRSGDLDFARRWLHPEVYSFIRQHKFYL